MKRIRWAGIVLFAAWVVTIGWALRGAEHAHADVPAPSVVTDSSTPVFAAQASSTQTVTYTVSVFLPLVTRMPEPAWITGTFKGLYSICQNASDITSTLQGLGGFTLSWDDTGGGASASLGDPLGNTWDCRSVMVFAFPPDAPHGRVLTGSMSFSNAWTTIQNKNVLPQDVPVGFRQTNWTAAPPNADARALWFDTSPETWLQGLPSFQDLCFHTTVSIPPGALVVGGPEVGLMVYSSSIDRPDLWQQDYGRFVDYGHYLTWGGSCPGPKPTLRLLAEPEVAP